MPGATLQTPQKRVLADATNRRNNVQSSPRAAKKLKIEGTSPASSLKAPTRIVNGKHPGSSQQKSQFEEEVLDKLTQDINNLKENNSEKDQQWSRPSLAKFDEKTDSLRFQQIEAEEGILHGGKTTIKLFGVTEVLPTP
jgi:DNA polymerase delta subunit 1